MYGYSEFDGFDALMAASEATEVDPTIYTCEATGHAPAAVLDAHPERRRGTVSGHSAPNPMRCVFS